MLRLLLLRHAKAVPFTGSGDHERALTQRGRADATRLGAFIASEKIAVQAAVHSGARRTKETFAIAVKEFQPGLAASIEPRLYEASAATFLDVLRGRSDSAGILIVVGHNPSMAEIARRLAASGDRRALARMTAKFPTSALAILDFEGDHWRAVHEGAGRLVSFTTPASLGGLDD
jgi:phosphohistidine phosphatase